MPVDETLRVAGLTKSYGANAVLRGVDLTLRAGEITVLMGANGAGKSTLVKIICGAAAADGGSMLLEGRPFAPTGPADAMAGGVVTVHQAINDGVVGALDVATNLTLDRLNGAGAAVFLNRRRMRRDAETVAARLGLAIDLRAITGNLSLADRQMVAIARAMARDPRVLILDEPTSSLSSAEANRLFALLDRLRDAGVAILVISHRMSDIRRLADCIFALRDGAIVGRFENKPLDYEAAVTAMLGKTSLGAGVDHRDGGAVVFEGRRLVLRHGAQAFDLMLRDGEVVAVTGLVGVGKTALAETLFGARQVLGGTMSLRGRRYAPSTPAEAIAAGVFLVAKDRAESGIVGAFDLAENASLPFLTRFSRAGIVRRGAERAAARRQIDALSIVCRSERDAMSALSGGNQQKVMVGRWMGQAANLFILDEPFQGVDIAARRDIGARLRADASGRATLLFVTELDEALETADRILVMSEHTLVGEHRNQGLDMEHLMGDFAGRDIMGAA